MVYEYGASSSANTATRQRRTTTINPAMASRFRNSRRNASRVRLVPRGRSSAAARALTATSIPDTWVEDAIQELDDEVHEGQERAVDQDHGHDHRVVPPGHRVH